MKTKDVSIQLIRILSMFSIILCHLVQELNNPTLAQTGQLFNVGVYIFLFLSGWLYGNKEINDICNWILGRVKRVLVPMWIFMIFLFFIYSFQGTMNLWYIPIFLTNTQYWFGKIRGGAHLWFISVIFLCYLMIPLLQKVKNKLEVIIPVMVLTGYALCYLSRTEGMIILYISVFIIGYVYKNKNVELSWKLAVSLIILALVIRLGSKVLLDGTVLYDCLLVYLTHTALTVGVFVLGRKFLIFKSGKIVNWFDDISYFVYITHYMFMVGPLRTMRLTENLFVNVVITLTVSFVTAAILRMIYRFVVRENRKNTV